MGSQSFYIRLPDALARRLRAFLDQPDSGFASLDEFVEVAVLNQLSVQIPERQPETVVYNAPPPGLQFLAEPRMEKDFDVAAAVHAMRPVDLFKPPPAEPPVPLAEATDPDEQELSILTNRLSQLKVAVRVCANLSRRGSWPVLREYHDRASRCARAIGYILRGYRTAEKSVWSRVHIGYPIGDDEDKALQRFASSFTVSVSGSRVSGPLAVLGLANLIDGRVALTEAGWRFAALPSAITKESETGVLLSPDEADLLRVQILRTPGELASVREFLRGVRRAHGSIEGVDDFLNKEHTDWNTQTVIAHRAAMAGRLSDVDVIEVEGRGPKGHVKMLPAATQFLD